MPLYSVSARCYLGFFYSHVSFLAVALGALKDTPHTFSRTHPLHKIGGEESNSVTSFTLQWIKSYEHCWRCVLWIETQNIATMGPKSGCYKHCSSPLIPFDSCIIFMIHIPGACVVSLWRNDWLFISIFISSSIFVSLQEKTHEQNIEQMNKHNPAHSKGTMKNKKRKCPHLVQYSAA